VCLHHRLRTKAWVWLQPSHTSSLLHLAHRSHRETPCGRHRRAHLAPACLLVAGMPGGVRGRGLMRRIAWPRSGTTAPSATARPRALVVSRSDPTVSMRAGALLSPSRPCPAPPNLGGGYQVALGLRESSHKSRDVDRGPRRSNEPRAQMRPLPSAVPTGAMRRSSCAASCIRCAAVSSWISRSGRSEPHRALSRAAARRRATTRAVSVEPPWPPISSG
jgi:hypothetical protein